MPVTPPPFPTAVIKPSMLLGLVNEFDALVAEVAAAVFC